MPGALGIHILGRGFGESIVVECPNGGVGLIDCFSPRLVVADGPERRAANPILKFLIEVIEAESLTFVGLTHPHEDHGRALSHVFDEYRDRIGQIWMFHGFQSLHVDRLLGAMRRSSKRLPIERLLNEPPGTFAVEIAAIRDRVIAQISESNPRRAKFRSFQGFKHFRIPGEPVSCAFLGPCDALAAAYEAHIIDNLAAAFDDTGEHVVAGWRPDDVNHNLISPALLFCYGGTQVLLGGDMEIEAWKQVLSEQDDPHENRPELTCQLIKVAHHGSSTGFHESLAARMAPGGRRPIAVLTPFNRHRHPLPTGEGLAQLLPHVSELVATNLHEARKAVGRHGVDSKVDLPTGGAELAQRGVPVAWLRDIGARPELLRAIQPALIQTSEARTPSLDIPPIPLRWYTDLASQPRLAQLLRPELCEHVARPEREPTIDTDCRVSFYFNDAGEELREQRYLGSAAGVWDE